MRSRLFLSLTRAPEVTGPFLAVPFYPCSGVTTSGVGRPGGGGGPRPQSGTVPAVHQGAKKFHFLKCFDRCLSGVRERERGPEWPHEVLE
ncbi:hypothetical protein NPIL_303571 [Nephila pilipes]|uniref:Uncharacterized protein n=1 Tax=Nephila pilipes TaxID=299642 RepID=A0A8X6QKY1_NEPPI|nr:hypothetical protein NPIL_303571 [Nephila pilipes]